MLPSNRSSLIFSATTVGAVDLEFLDLLAKIVAPAAFSRAANARQMAADGAFRGAGLGGLKMGLRPLADRTLGAHVSPRRAGQRAPGAATKGRTERAQLELTARGGDHLRGHGRARDGGSATFLRKNGRADRQRTRAHQAVQSTARGSSHGQLSRLKSAPHGHGARRHRSRAHLSTPLATSSPVPHAPHLLPHCSLPSGVIGRHRAP